MKTRKIEHWVFVPSWQKDKVAEYIKEDYMQSSWSKDHYFKIEEQPMYSSQTTPKYLGGNPENGGKYNTYYYIVSREQFEDMENKPELVDVCRPLRLKNYDTIANPSIIQKEKKGIGWEEIETTFDKYYRYVYFVE